MSNCQCGTGFVGNWSKDRNGKSVPTWYCKSCDAYAGIMSSQHSRKFRGQFFSIKQWEDRSRWLRAGSFYIRELPIKKEEPKREKKQSRAAVQLKLFPN